MLVSPDSPLPAVVSGDTKTDQNAAADLCNYLTRITGRDIKPGIDAAATPRVIIHVGKDEFVRTHATEIEKLYADGFVIQCVSADEQHHLILAGRVEDASQWAIERFLKDYCGVRWLFPDPKYGEVVPSHPTLEIDRDLSRTIEPDYLSRGSVGMYHYNPAHTHLRGGGGNIGEYGDHAIQWIFNNGSYSGEIFEKHPEWFAWFNGKRNWWEYGNGWQICTTNPGTVDHAVQHILKVFEKSPNALVASVGNNDGWGECECPDCTAFLNSAKPPYTVGERWFTWVNQVAREVAKTHPDKTIVSLAYAQASTPTRFKLEPNVAITKTIVLDSELKLAEQWGKVCKSVNLYSYMYGNSFLGFRHYPHAARDFLKWGHDKLGARAHVVESGGEWTFDGPKNYYLQALHWDVNVDIDAVMDDFCQSSYGQAAAPMRMFWNRLEEIYERRRPTPHGEKNRRMLFYQWCGWVVSSYVQPNDEFQEYTSEDVSYLDVQMAEANRLAGADSEAVQFRVDRMEEAWRYYRTALVSFTRFYEMNTAKTASQADLDRNLAIVKEISDVRAERSRMLGAMRRYPHINTRTAGDVYWSWNEALTIFNHELTLADELCGSITRYMTKTSGELETRTFWERFGPTDPMYDFAETQLEGLGDVIRADLITNGSFEDGTLQGWETSGNVNAIASKSRSSQFHAHSETGESAELSQRVQVKPRERYRLSAMVRYPTAPPATAVPLESIVEFYAGDQRIWDSEPTRNVLRSKNPLAGWISLVSVVDVPPTASHAIVRLKRTFQGAAEWDQIKFERIKTGIDDSPANFAETFDGSSLDPNRWFQSSSSGGTRPPEIRNGWLDFNSDEIYPLTSYASFHELLNYEGSDRYVLKLHIAQNASGQPSSLDFAIQTGSGAIRSGVTGMYWSHSFGDSSNSSPSLSCYAAQGAANTHGATYPLRNVTGDATEIWYTLVFDRKNVSIFAAKDGYGEQVDALLVARYPHGISNLRDSGDVFLKIHGRSCRVDELLISSPTMQTKSTSTDDRTTDDPAKHNRRLIMPGVTD